MCAVTRFLVVDGSPKPLLVFCSSRKGCEETSAKLVDSVPPRAGYQGGPPHPFVQTAQAAQALREAAGRVEAQALAALLPHGVGFYTAGLTPSDRDVVLNLFRASILHVLCTTSALAQGVNLPARVVVVRGTKIYGAGGYRDYIPSEVLQMVGRAGRPQFDDKGLGVVLTESSHEGHYRQLLACGGSTPVESRLADSLAEHLCSEIVGRTLCDVSEAVAWLKASFWWRRLCSHPAGYGLPPSASAEEKDRAANSLLLRACAALADAKCVLMDDDGFGMSSLPPGVELSRQYVAFSSLQAASALPPHASFPQLLALLCSAEEFSLVALRHSEKVLLKGLIANVPFGLTDDEGRKLKVVTTATQKLFLLFQDALSAAPSEKVAASYTLRTEAGRVFADGPRIATVLTAFFRHTRALAGFAHSLALKRACEHRGLEFAGAAHPARQLPGIGAAGARHLTSAGLRSLDDIEAADAGRLEQLVGRVGRTLHESLARHARVEIVLEPKARAGGAAVSTIEFEVTVRLLRREGAQPPAGATSAVTLLCGSRNDDQLLFSAGLSVPAAAEGWESRHHFTAALPSGTAKLTVVAGVVFHDIVGRDVTVIWRQATPGDAGAGDKRPAAVAFAPAPAAKRAAKQGTLTGAFSTIASKGAQLGGNASEILAKAKTTAMEPPGGSALTERVLTPAHTPAAAAPASSSEPSGEAGLCDELFEGLF